jgi:anti-sigma B factor antagonist
MNMELVVTEHILRTVIVQPHSRVDAFNAPALRERLEQLLAEDVRFFVLDLSNVPFLDSAGMAVLVSVLKRARQADGDVKLIWPREEAARRILRLTRFDRVFAMAETVSEALKQG